MKFIFSLFISFLVWTPTQAQDILSKEDQIISATQIAPEKERANATVIGYNADFNQIVLKKGTGNLICIANNPKSKSFSVACYHKDLDPMMARGRVLRKLGKNRSEIETIRAAEAKAGTLKLPKNPSTLYVLYGKKAHYDKDSKKIIDGNIRYVVYIPWATVENTGLPTAPQVPGGPWIMFPGTYRSHIMITPATK